MKNKAMYIVFALVAILGIGGLVRAYALNQTVNVEGDYVYNEATGNTPIEPDVNLGAFSGPDFYSDYLNFNGITSWYNKTGLKTGTTTICSIKAPAATSTLVHASVSFTTGTSTASTIVMAKAATAYATTTPVTTTTSVGADAQATIVASSTNAAYFNARLFEPNYYLNVGMNSETEGTVSPVGNCQAIFQVLSE